MHPVIDLEGTPTSTFFIYIYSVKDTTRTLKKYGVIVQFIQTWNNGALLTTSVGPTIFISYLGIVI